MLFCSITNLIVLLLLGFFLLSSIYIPIREVELRTSDFLPFSFIFLEREKEKDRKESFIWFYLVFIQTIIHFLCSSDHTCRIFFLLSVVLSSLETAFFFSFLNTQRRQTSNINFFLKRQLKQLPTFNQHFRRKQNIWMQGMILKKILHTNAHTMMHLKNQRKSYCG